MMSAEYHVAWLLPSGDVATRESWMYALGGSKLLFFLSSTIRHHLFWFHHTAVSPYWHFLLWPVAATLQGHRKCL